jgi:hypothetical protein
MDYEVCHESTSPRVHSDGCVGKRGCKLIVKQTEFRPRRGLFIRFMSPNRLNVESWMKNAYIYWPVCTRHLGHPSLAFHHPRRQRPRASQRPTYFGANHCDMPTELKGSCHCGAVKFNVQAFAPVPYQVCQSIGVAGNKTKNSRELGLDARPVGLRVWYMHESMRTRRRHIPRRSCRYSQDRGRGVHKVSIASCRHGHITVETHWIILAHQLLSCRHRNQQGCQ